jgi:signal transduction histidine kinase/CheY-like chemotaxis protein
MLFTILTLECVALDNKGMSSLLMQTKMTLMQEESMLMIITSGDLLLAIVNDVLDYAKLETENVEIDIKRSNLQDTLSSVIHSIEMKAHSTQLVKPLFDVTLPEYVHIDSRRLQQILFNLLGNAIKFSRKDGVVGFSVEMVTCPMATTGAQRGCNAVEGTDESSSSVSSCPSKLSYGTDSMTSNTGSESDDGAVTRCPFHKATSPKEGTPEKPTKVPVPMNGVAKQVLRFVVKDHGKGIDAKDFDRIFQPFHQASGSEPEDVYGGTGLGLAITQKLVAAMGGVISVDSKKGSWSKFTVDLPCHDAPVNVSDIASKMQLWRVFLVGASEHKKEIVIRGFTAYNVDITTFDSMSEMATAISGDSALSDERVYVCLVQEDAYQDELYKSLSKKAKSALLTFGPKYSVHDSEIAHHFRSLEQVIPSVLMETMIEKVRSAKEHQMEVEDVEEIAVSYSELRVLVAEDNKINQKVVLRMLGRLGVKHIDVVDNGLKACQMEAAQDRPYDIILMDQQMPIMGGVSACRHILNRAGGHVRPKVVFVTAHVSPNFEAECREAGSSGFLPKPFKLEQIEKCLQMLYTSAFGQ